MKIFCISDIHGCLAEFEYALSLILNQLEEDNTMLLLLGDYVHGGEDSKGVLEKIMSLQYQFGADKIIALLGNHEEWILNGSSSIESYEDEINEDKYIQWISSLPRYYVEGNTIFVHAGIDEEAGDLWEWVTSDEIFTMKYPAETGKVQNLDMKIVAGHVSTSEISKNPRFHDIYYDGESHYYIDGDVLESGVIPIIMVDTETNKYYRVTEGGNWIILPYDEENN